MVRLEVRTAEADAAHKQVGIAQDAAARGYGELNPVASNATAATRQLNRRVEIIISEDENAVTPR